MIPINSSAWIEFLVDTGSPVCERVEALLREEIATCDPILMDILAGARIKAHQPACAGCWPARPRITRNPVTTKRPQPYIARVDKAARRFGGQSIVLSLRSRSATDFLSCILTPTSTPWNVTRPS